MRNNHRNGMHPTVFIIAALTAFLLKIPNVSAQDMLTTSTWVTNGTVRAIVRTSDTIYLGGDFTYVGPNTGGGVPVSSVNGGLALAYPRINGVVSACAADGAGGWYLGGYFTKAGNQPRNNLAHILADGSVDPAWHPNVTGAVKTLARSGGTVYLGGSFTTIEGQLRNHLGAVDATSGELKSWNPDVTIRFAPYPATIETLAVSGSTVYAGGVFSSIGGQNRNNIAALDAVTGQATAWDANATGSYPLVNALVISGSTLYAGGLFSSMNGQDHNYIAAVDLASGTAKAWNPYANGPVYALAVSGSTVYAGGTFTYIGGQSRQCLAGLDTSSGNATAWAPGAINGIGGYGPCIFNLTVSGPTVYAGGSFSSLGGQIRNCIAAMDATTGAVTPLTVHASSDVKTLAITGSTLYVGGQFGSIGGQMRNYIAALDGKSGRATSWNPSANSSVYTLTVAGPSVYAGGNFTSIGGQVRNYIAALDATSGAATSWNPNAVGQVQALTISGSTVYAGGSFLTIGGQTRNRLAALDITSGLPTLWNPNANGEVSTLVASDTTIYAGGNFTNIGSQTRNHLAAVDITTGNPTGWDPNANDQVLALAMSNSTIYAGGKFTATGGQTRNHLAAWDKASGNLTAWNPNANNTVNAIAIADSTIYTGGFFTNIGGQAHTDLAALDALSGNASAWSADANSGIYALSMLNGLLSIGGNFTSLGGYLQPYFAVFDFSAPAMPSNPGAINIQSSQITWTWQDHSNNEDGFKVWADAGVSTPTTLRAMTGVNSQSWTMTDLTGNTLYAFQAASTRAGFDSNRTGIFTARTLMEPIAGLTFSGLSATSIAVAPSKTLSNLNIGSSGLYLTNTTAGTNSGWRQTATPYPFTSLAPNCPYQFKAKARNADGIETAEINGSTWTLAALPAAPVVNGVSVNSMNVTIGVGDGNPAATQYAIQCPTTGKWVQANGTLGGTPAWRTATAWGTIKVSGLLDSTLYAFCVLARNGGGILTAAGPSASATTPLGPPDITTQPATKVVKLGDDIIFNVVVRNTAPMNYQWRMNGLNLNDGGRIAGTKTAGLTITAAQLTDAGYYSCVVSNAVGKTTSTAARLTVNPTVTIISAHGTSVPVVGVTGYTSGTMVTARLSAAIVTDPADPKGTTRWLCTGWTATGAAPASGTATSVSFKLTQPTTLTWLWKTQYKLTATADPASRGSVRLADGVTAANGSWHDANAKLTLKAVPNAGSKFAFWWGALGGRTNPCNLTLGAPATVGARFDTSSNGVTGWENYGE